MEIETGLSIKTKINYAESNKEAKEIYKTRYVAVDEIIEWLNSNSFGFRDSGINNIDSDELIKLLKGE